MKTENRLVLPMIGDAGMGKSSQKAQTYSEKISKFQGFIYSMVTIVNNAMVHPESW